MQHEHGISFVEDDALTEGQDFMFVQLAGGGSRIFYRESAITPTVLEDSWAAYRRLVDEDDGPDDGEREPLPPPMKTLVLVSGSRDPADLSREFSRYAV